MHTTLQEVGGMTLLTVNYLICACDPGTLAHKSFMIPRDKI